MKAELKKHAAINALMADILTFLTATSDVDDRTPRRG